MIVVSGLERSGTSLMMQILKDAGYELCYDDKRKPDINNPKGYYELNDGKIIATLMDRQFNEEEYHNKVIKITAYGIPLIDSDKYRVVYMERNLYEVNDSQHKMMDSRQKQWLPEDDEIRMLEKVNELAKSHLIKNSIDFVPIDYNDLIKYPRRELNRLSKFLGKDITDSIKIIDKKLYRNRRNKRWK